MPTADNLMSNVFNVVKRPQTYVNVFYLLLSFPLGIAYFVFLVTGLSVGFGLVVIWVGVPILALVLAGSWALSRFEQESTSRMLHVDIPPIPLRKSAEPIEAGDSLSGVERIFIGTWRQFKAQLSDRLTWTGMLYLLIKFPIGVASFVIVVTLVSVTAALLGAPFFYGIGDGTDFGFWEIDELWEALVLMLAGVPTLFASLHIMNGAAYVSGQVARVMLGKLR